MNLKLIFFSFSFIFLLFEMKLFVFYFLIFNFQSFLFSTEISSSSDCKIIETPQKLKSSLLESSQEIELTFENLGEELVDVYWINYEGVEVYMDTIESHQSSFFTSFLGNAWRIKLQLNGNVIFEKVIQEDKSSILFQVGKGCNQIGFEFNTSEYTFKTLSNIELVPNPQLVETAIQKSPCFSLGISDWINKYVVANGYHVLCITKSTSPKGIENINSNFSVSIEAWKDGYLSINQNSGQTFLVSR